MKLNFGLRTVMQPWDQLLLRTTAYIQTLPNELYYGEIGFDVKSGEAEKGWVPYILKRLL